MIIRCIKCQSPFENNGNMTRRICSNKHEKKHYTPNRTNQEFWYVLGGMKRYFQNPIYQLYSLLSSEHVQPSSIARAKFDESELDNIGEGLST